MQTLKRVSYTQGGLRASRLLAFIDRAEAVGMHSFMLLRRGQVLTEGWWQPYAPQYPHMLYSLSKSFTSTAIGFAVQEGLISVEDRVKAECSCQCHQRHCSIVTITSTTL